jgi:hypothetical protein
MIKKVVVVASGGALAFALGGVADAGMARASVHRANLPRTLTAPQGTPVIRGSAAQPGNVLHGKISAPPDTPVVRGSTARPSHLKIWAPGDPPVIRRLVARTGDPDDGGQLTARTGDPDDGGEIS